MFKTKQFCISLIIFILLNTFLYIFIIFFNQVMPFSSFTYLYDAHHYFVDPRGYHGNFQFLRALGVWDAQWYLRLGDAGYPSKQVFMQHPDPRYMGGLSYAFSPFYPLVLACMNIVFHNIELTAFIVTNLLLLANFFSLYYVITKFCGNHDIATRTIFLLFLFPFSVFYRSYFTEGLFLLLLIWFAYFLMQKRWFLTALFLALLSVTRPNGIFLAFVLAGSLYVGVRNKTISFGKAFVCLLVSLIFFQGWLFFNYVQTGDPMYFYAAESVWFKAPNFFYPLAHNIMTILSFWSLPLHSFHVSKLDVTTIIVTGILLFMSRKFLKPQLWWISFIIWIVPLVTKDTMSYTRYQIVSFPLFFYLGAKLRGVGFYLFSGIFLVLLLVTSLYFINWYWVG